MRGGGSGSTRTVLRPKMHFYFYFFFFEGGGVVHCTIPSTFYLYLPVHISFLWWKGGRGISPHFSHHEFSPLAVFM